MMRLNRWGLAAGLAAALAFVGTAQAQSSQSSGSTSSSGAPSGATGGSGDTGSSAGQSATERRDAGSAPVTGGRGASTEAERGTGSSRDTAAGGTGSRAGTSATAGGAQKLDKGLQEKLEKIHAANQAELHMAKIGQQNAQSPEVKSYAEQLEVDHQKLDDQLTQTAQTLGVTLEGEKFRKEHDKSVKDMDEIQKKTGADFDKEFMDRMVKDHKKDLKEVRAAAKDAQKGQHGELASVLNQAETGIQGHLTQAEQISKSLKGDRPGTRAGADRPGAMGGTGSGASDASGSGPTGASKHGAGGPGTSGAGSTANPELPKSDQKKSQ